VTGRAGLDAVPWYDGHKKGMPGEFFAQKKDLLGGKRQFEAFVMALAKEMPISQIGELVGEQDTRIWRIVRGYVDRAYAAKEYKSFRGGIAKAIRQLLNKSKKLQ
jgi:hypothetical protein